MPERTMLLLWLLLDCSMILAQETSPPTTVPATQATEPSSTPPPTSPTTSSTIATSTTTSQSTNPTLTTPILAPQSTPNSFETRRCGNPTDTTICFYQNSTRDMCDICNNFSCPLTKKCIKAQDRCAPDCICEKEFEKMDQSGNCHNVCEPNPCHTGQCVLNSTSSSKYSCNCSSGYEGNHCEKIHNYCSEPSPANCPSGAFTCSMLGVNNYTCNCADGYFLNISNNSCIKVGQTALVSIHFKQTPYSEVYNNATHPDARYARKVIKVAFTSMFTSRLIDIQFLNFTQGSLVANLQVLLHLPTNGSIVMNEYDFRKHILACEMKSFDAADEACFGSLGKTFLPLDAWISRDERCSDVFCPQTTHCSPLDGISEATRCSCLPGFSAVGSTVDSSGRIVEQYLDECLTVSCLNKTVCVNRVGSYECATSPCANVTCMGSAICRDLEDGVNYVCECGWIYAGAGCSFPWTLILLILVIIFLLLAAGAVGFYFFRRNRNRVGVYQMQPDQRPTIKTSQNQWH